MKESIEALLGTFFLVLMSVASMCCISSAIDYRNADATKTAYIAEIENSNFSKQVLAGVFTEAGATDGYSLTMKLYHRDGTVDNVTQADYNTNDEDAIPNTNDVYMIRLKLDFSYKFPLLNVAPVSHSLVGYAR